MFHDTVVQYRQPHAAERGWLFDVHGLSIKLKKTKTCLTPVRRQSSSLEAGELGEKDVRRMDREYDPYAAVQIPPCGMVKKLLLIHHTCRIHGMNVVYDRFSIARIRAIGVRAEIKQVIGSG